MGGLLHRGKWKKADSENQKCACLCVAGKRGRNIESVRACAHARVGGLSRKMERRVKRRRVIREFEKKSVKT